MKLSEYLENYNSVEQVYGYWPSFHDAEIKSVLLETYYKEKEDYVCPFIEITLHCFEMTSKVLSNGFYELIKHNLIKFRFEDVHDSELVGFDHQNAILSLEFEILPKNERGFTPILVEIDPANGLGGKFKAFSGKVVEVFPCDSTGKLKSDRGV
ncbi:Imm50 family immunity protein [Teredinibacter sp. KSP-S5-2]|uniref:Imm50 family immunity protein n=1 Tax=Teredinibacter sp. KSP-S5-2 TaxID=3034506 RepID=UPI002934F706|nr:Imm50 family immunity protein [Teredinibacter sp. KSP-S5-2]WNO10081.1 Imm50 family immunity protein [Teredinibacter sp. KSP-S5-2]